MSNSEVVYLKCVEDGSKLRVRIVSPGFFADANCQFPRSLRSPGRFFSAPASSISLARMGSKYIYRVKASSISVLEIAPTRAQIRRSHRASDSSSSETLQSTRKRATKSSSSAQKLPDKVYEDEEDVDCVVCMDAPKALINVPCGHFCLCENCTLKLEILADKKCPICRTKIDCCISPSQITK